MTQPIDLAAIKAICAAATPGPWCLASRGGEQSHDSVWPVDLNAEQRIAVIENTDDHSGDARLIAESRAMVPALVAEIERLRAEAAEAEQARSLIERAVRWADDPCDLLNLSSIVETIADRYAEVGGDALWGRLSQEPNASVDLQFLREAVYAVWTGEPMADETNDGLTGAFVEIERLRVEAAERAVEMDRLRDELDRADPHAMTLLEQAVDRLEAERRAILDAGGDALWAGGAKTLPEAVTGALHALDVALTRSAKEYDQSPAAKVRHAFPHLAFTDADLVRWAVERAGRGEYRRQRWAVVGEMFARGSHVARELCRACGCDPDEMVGDDGEGEE